MANRKKPKGTKFARLAARRAEKLRSGGPDASGNYGPNTYTARWHVVEIAPKELRSNPNSTQHPKRYPPPIEWYKSRGLIDGKEYRAAEALLAARGDGCASAKVTAGYDPVMVQSSPDADGRMIQHIDGEATYRRLLEWVPSRCRGVVEAVLVGNMRASEWAQQWGWKGRASERHGLARLRQGLSALAQHLRA